MAAITFKIGGKYDGSAITKAQNGLKKLTNSAKLFNVAVAGFVVKKVFDGVNKVVAGSTDAFKAQNKALTTFNTSMKQSAKISKESVATISTALDNLSNNNFFDADSLRSGAALAANMGLDAENVAKVMDAATELAAAGIMPLNTAVQALSRSYAGNVTQLSKYIPALKDLTDEQLANGEAVDEVLTKYAGFRKAMANTFSGRDSQFKNSLEDLRAAIGGIFESVSFVSKGNLLEPMQNLTKVIEENRENIVKLFLRLPEIAQSAFSTIGDYLTSTFTGDGMKNLLTLFAKNIGTALEYGIRLGVNSLTILKNAFQAMLAGGDSDSFMVQFSSAISSAFNTAIKAFNKFVDYVHNNDTLNALVSFLTGGRSDTWGEIDVSFVTDPEEISRMSKELKLSLNASNEAMIAEQKALFSCLVTDLTSNAKNFFSFYKSDTATLISELERILGEDLPEDLREALSAGASSSSSGSDSTALAVTGASTAITTATDSVTTFWGEVTRAMRSLAQSAASSVKDLLTSIGGVFSTAGTLVGAFQERSAAFASAQDTFTSAMEGVAEGTAEAAAAQEGLEVALKAADAAFKSNIIGLIISLIVKLASSLAEVSPSMNKLMDGLDVIMDTIADIIGDVMEDFLKPFADGLKPIGQILGSILSIFAELANGATPLNELFTTLLKILAPIIGAIATIIRLLIKFNPIMLLVNGIIKALTRAFSAVYNAIKSIFKKISLPTGISISWSGVSVKWKSLASFLKMGDDDEGEEDSDSSSSSSSSSGASYTASKDVYVTINFNSSYVNGDAQAIAIMLAREIQTAEKMNLI